MVWYYFGLWKSKLQVVCDRKYAQCVEYVPRQGKKHFIQKEDNVKRIITSTFVKYECLQFLYVKYRYL
jgi:hypothetical protein